MSSLGELGRLTDDEYADLGERVDRFHAARLADPSVTLDLPRGPKIMGNGFVGTSGADMIAWVKQVEGAGGLGIVVFHGVGGDYLSVTAEAHQQLVDYLAASRDRIWTARYSEAMAYVVKHGR